MNRHFKKYFENYFVIGFSVVLVIIVLALAIITANSTPTQPTPQDEPTTSDDSITPLPTFSSPLRDQPLENPGSPPVSYDSAATDRLIDKVQNRTVLANSDQNVKKQILETLPSGETSGYVYESASIRIEYIQSPDVFLIEILTTDIERAKADASEWFRNTGMSQDGICNIPVSFYLNWEVAQQLRNRNFLFNPLPNGC